MASPVYRSASSAAALAPAVEETLEADGPVPFSSIQESIHPDTYKALTQEPFAYTDMSSVQAAVLTLLPELAEPHNPSSGQAQPTRDLLVKAKTGTGKTIAFLVPAIEARLRALEEVGEKAVRDSGLKNDPRVARAAENAYARKNVGTLIISPTRELAIQIANEAMKLTKHRRHGVHLFVGGENKGRQLRFYNESRKDIVVVTPGRMKDYLQTAQEDIKGALANMNTVCIL